MYQEIDEQDEEDFAPRPKFSILPFIIGAILAGLVFFVVWLMSPGQPAAPGQSVETPASRSAYLKALAEPDPAVRRARLMDYQLIHPDTDRSDAIADQLEVINNAELQDWEALVQIVYNDRLDKGEKTEALTAYEARWNGRLLGGRSEELPELRAIVDATETNVIPDRKLEPGESPIPENIPSDVLAGAPPQLAVTTPIPPPAPPKAPVNTAPKNIVIPPSVRRNSSPSYPRAAKRKNIGAIVVVSMDINTKGRVEDVEVIDIQTERYEKDFSRAARRAAKRTRFHPKTINGIPVPAKDVRKRYIFKAN